MKQYQLSVRSYMNKDKEPANFITEEFDTEGEVYEHITSNLLDNNDCVIINTKQELEEYEDNKEHEDNKEYDSKTFPKIFRADGGFLMEGREPRKDEIVEYAANNERYLRIFDLADLEDVREIEEYTEMFDADSDGAFYLDVDMSDSTPVNTCSFKKQLIGNLRYIYDFHYVLVEDHKTQSHDDRVPFSQIGLVGNRVLFLNDTLEIYLSGTEKFNYFIENSQIDWLITSDDDDKKKLKELLNNNNITKEEYAEAFSEGHAFYNNNCDLFHTNIEEVVKEYYLDVRGSIER